ncbi:hypothetical protein GE061_012018 [Apolygus lucorum]|uniref:SHSP domain-containing protein n=1 Tax=Apolygus lucorum TaxID=248454 RepID=A0A8S9XTT3_APOLU|nr:hypothetical protein GE061_012018 [Apolygus lucorum]
MVGYKPAVLPCSAVETLEGIVCCALTKLCDSLVSAFNLDATAIYFIFGASYLFKDFTIQTNMALLPVLFNHLLDEVKRPQRRSSVMDLYDQHFGLGFDDFEEPSLRSLCDTALQAGYLRPWRRLSQLDSGISQVKSDGNEFSVKLDVNHFKPEELKVKLDDDGYIVVQGEHEERSDQHGFISRQFRRRYKLPEDVMPDSFKSKLSTDGVLSITAAKKPVKRGREREIEIIRTNQPAIKKQDAEEIEAKKKRTEKTAG